MNRDRLDLSFDPAHLAFGEKPLEWRHGTPDGLTWRLADWRRADDLSRLRKLWDEMDDRLGKQDRPDLTNLPVVVVLVAEDDATGEMVSALYGENVVDFTMIGTSRRVARSIPGIIPHLQLHLWAHQVHLARVFVPRRMERHMAKLMPQLLNITNKFASFVFSVRA